MQLTYDKRSSWLDRPLWTSLVINAETILFVGILILGVVSRFYNLQARVMSHDENSHVYYSWLLYRGQGYRHDPITHGPLQFHLVALSYFLFGDNDFTARIPAALFSVAAIAFMWFYRRYLGKAGALVAAVLLLISPYMLFYGRYVRNEAFVAFFGVVTLWAILRYLETGQARFMFFLTTATVLHFTAKETAFIYTAQALVFLGLYFIYQVSRKPWAQPEFRNLFFILLIAALLLAGVTAGLAILYRGSVSLSATETAAPAVPGQSLEQPGGAGPNGLLISLAAFTLVVFLTGLYLLLRGYSWKALKNERSFDLIIVLLTLVLPMLAPFPAKAMGVDPTNYNDPQVILITGVFVVLLAIIAAGIGLLWKPRLWLLNAGLFYVIFIVFYTTVFTNGFGFVTGLVGALGYWLKQQGVNRGSQPFYYYYLIQVPIYEYLPALGSLFALVWVFFHRNEEKPDNPDHYNGPSAAMKDLVEAQGTDRDQGSRPGVGLAKAEEPVEEGIVKPPIVALLGFWAVTSLLAYSYAGEKMPWLTVHITLPMILLSGWSIGSLIDSIDWTAFKKLRGWLVVLLLPVFLVGFLAAAGSLLGTQRPFAGKDLEQLRVTTTFVTSLLAMIISGVGLYNLVQPWPAAHFNRVITLFVFGFLGLLTARTAFRAAYINYDYATEYLVYAHSAPGVKEALAQITEISERTTDGLAMPVAYDDQTSYPYWWYLRNFTDQRYYAANPTRDLRDAPAILVGETNYGKIEPVVANLYDEFDYIRLWWPNQDYFNLTWDRIWGAISNPQMRSAVFQVWLNRDYKLYSQLTNQDMSLPNWSPSAKMRLYVRKDIVSQLWNYGSAPTAAAAVQDPYEGKQISLSADRIIGSNGHEAGQFFGPRDLAVASDGSVYVADTKNHRIQHLAPDGSVLQVWGSFADVSKGPAPGGTFYEPWGIALGTDGSVFVADTWNHRIQKFTPDGQFVKMWGFFDQTNDPNAFWGPRDVAVDAQGHVFVTDTGNKRVDVFDEDGNFTTRFGEEGFGPGQFDEPVGLAAGPDGRVYVADTWNQRIQVFQPSADGTYTQVNSWDVAAWYGESLDNKPYLAVDDQGHLFATDPEGSRVLEFSTDGQFIQYWGNPGQGADGFDLAGSVAIDPTGGVWVTDCNRDDNLQANGRLMHFTLPAQ